MSVLFSSPVGYPDDQQLPQWQSQVVLQRTDTIAALGSLTYPTIQCSNWKSVTINYQSGIHESQLLLQWFSDKALTVLLGSKIIVVDAALFCNVTIPNQGPYLSINVTSANSSPVVTMIASLTNRDGMPWSPQNSLPLIDVQAVSIPANTSQTFTANYAYSGPAFFGGTRTASGFKFQLQGLELFGNSHIFYLFDTSTGSTGGNPSSLMIIPPLRLQCVVQNETASASSFWATVVPDLFH